MGLFTFVLSIVNTILLALLLLRLPKPHSGGETQSILRLIQMGPAKALVANIDRVHKGMTKEDVDSILAAADDPGDHEWRYYLDDDSGYIVSFNTLGRVEAVRSWKR